MWYKLDEKKVIKVGGPMDMEVKSLVQDTINGTVVTTVFKGFSLAKPAATFETSIHDGINPGDRFIREYRTYRQAVKGHYEIAIKVLKGYTC